jgi:hypothetical protein
MACVELPPGINLAVRKVLAHYRHTAVPHKEQAAYSADCRMSMLAADDYSFAPYRSRYSTEESSNAVYEKDQRHHRCLGRYDLISSQVITIYFHL